MAGAISIPNRGEVTAAGLVIAAHPDTEWVSPQPTYELHNDLVRWVQRLLMFCILAESGL